MRRPKLRQHRTFYNIDELWRKLLSNRSIRPSFLNVSVIKMFGSSVLAGYLCYVYLLRGFKYSMRFEYVYTIHKVGD